MNHLALVVGMVGMAVVVVGQGMVVLVLEMAVLAVRHSCRSSGT